MHGLFSSTLSHNTESLDLTSDLIHPEYTITRRDHVLNQIMAILSTSLLMLWCALLATSHGDPDQGRIASQQQQQLTSRTVRTKYGDVSGVIVTLDSRHLEPVEVFRGIPYASPPLGSLRFMPPVTGALWSGVKVADRFGPVCPQRLPDISNETAALKRMPMGRLEYLKRLMPFLKNQSEDCLYLNIYAPAQGRLRTKFLFKKRP